MTSDKNKGSLSRSWGVVCSDTKEVISTHWNKSFAERQRKDVDKDAKAMGIQHTHKLIPVLIILLQKRKSKKGIKTMMLRGKPRKS